MKTTSQKLSEFEKNKIYGLVALITMLLLGFIVTNIQGGLLGEEKIYILLGGQERNQLALSFMKFLDFFGSSLMIIPFVIFVLIYSIRKKNKVLALGISFSSLGVFLLNTIMKLFFQRPRPQAYMLVQEASTSYPSGHAMTNTCLYLFLAYYFSRYINPEKKKLYYSFAIFGSVLMCFSRVFLGVHYISDVVGGFLGGYFFFVLTVSLCEN